MSLYDFRDQLKHALDCYYTRLTELQNDEENKLDELSKGIIKEELTKLNDYRSSLNEFFERNIGSEPLKIFKSALKVYGKVLENNKNRLLLESPSLNVKKLQKEIDDIPRIVEILKEY